VDLAGKLHEDRSVPVLIEGDTGTGKEIIARMVHYGKSMTTSPFITINCSAISATLFETELFGYEGGAFTGALKSGQIGKLELARGGSLFLDEIGDMPRELQPKLLRVLQMREFYRVGGLKQIQLDARIICATNLNLEQMVEEGTFRRDLYYRLNTCRLRLPALRERKKSIKPLAQMFLEQFAQQKNRRFKTIHPEALKILEEYPWPGNVRELQNVIERVVLLNDELEIRPEHLYFLSAGKAAPRSAHAPQSPADSIIVALDGDNVDLVTVESEIIRRVLNKFGGNKSKTAEFLGITRGTLRTKLKQAM
jgi:two-component system, NtrC family, response regulator AtoC